VSVEVYAVGLVCASACAPVDATCEEIEAAVNLEHPTGISSQWRIAEDKQFSSGQPMPCPCESNDDRQHWLLNC
jgi:hypothetical protein